MLKLSSAPLKAVTVKQRHLDYANRVNLGSYYTGGEYVSIVWDLVRPLIKGRCVVLDSSCGYGSFLFQTEGARIIGNDIDSTAAEQAKKDKPFAEILNFNALVNLSRSAYGISHDENLIVVGNPPYNDTTSIIRNGTKRQLFDIDPSIASRDLGISFMLSYGKLEADYVCILHPLSYLIKKTNFQALKSFADSYRLADSVIISSGVFAQTSKSMQFPILIALYKREFFGMDYQYIEDYSFRTIEGKSFSLGQLDYIRNYLNKYPTKFHSPKEGDLFFYTMRDLNALKRNQTFMESYESNSIVVDKSKLDFYVYADVVKDFAHVFPYYFGNFDVLINKELFLEYRNQFISYALNKHSFLGKFYPGFSPEADCRDKIIQYFKQLLGEHYVESNNK